MSEPNEQVARGLVEYASELRGYLGQQASFLVLRFETAEDLYQGFASRALGNASRFVPRGAGSERAWLFEVARNYLRDRQRHWNALKRGSARVVRSGLGVGDSTAGGRDVAASQTGPFSFAVRREQLVLAARALALLLPRDRQIIEWSASSMSLEELAERLEVSAETASRARTRAMSRLRKTHELALRKALLEQG